jgi:phosphatidylinositol dimannoside acyltransferase
LIKSFVGAAGVLPVWFMRLFAVFIALPIAVPLTLKNFRAIVKNFRRMDSGGTMIKILPGAWLVYKNYAYYLIDLMYLSHGRERVEEYTITVTGGENLYKALEKGKGVVLLTSHLGNWEIGGRAIAEVGKKIHLVYSPDSIDIFDRQRERMRGDESVQGLGLRAGGFSSLRLYRLLEEGELVALQGDRLLFDRGTSVPFFGSLARFPQGPIRLAQLSGSPVVPIFIPMKGYKAYEIIIEAPLEMDPGQRIEDNLRRVTSVFERHIGLYRTQWYTFRPFWDEDVKGETF